MPGRGLLNSAGWKDQSPGTGSFAGQRFSDPRGLANLKLHGLAFLISSQVEIVAAPVKKHLQNAGGGAQENDGESPSNIGHLEA